MTAFKSWVDWSQYHDLRAALMGREFGRMSYCYFKITRDPDEFIDADTLKAVEFSDVEMRTRVNYGNQKFKEQKP